MPLPPPPPSYFERDRRDDTSALGWLISIVLVFGIAILAWRLTTWMYRRFPLGFGIILAVWAWVLATSPDDGGINSAAFAPWMFVAATGCLVWQIARWRGSS
ncbi:MAG TPA: hypothetical protein VH482_23675 [Thermomicrobiales bacterium]|jgi:hypothetical protein